MCGHRTAKVCDSIKADNLFIHQKAADHLQISLRLLDVRHVGRLSECDPLHFGYGLEERCHGLILSLVKTAVDEQCGCFDFMYVVDDGPVLQRTDDREVVGTVTACERSVGVTQHNSRKRLTQCDKLLDPSRFLLCSLRQYLVKSPSGTEIDGQRHPLRSGTLCDPMSSPPHASPAYPAHPVATSSSAFFEPSPNQPYPQASPRL